MASIVDKLWTQIIIFDPDALPGRNIAEIIKLMLTVEKFSFVIINDIEGASVNGYNGLINDLQDKENEILETGEILGLLNGVKQFDWGDFLLFKQYPSPWNNPEKNESYPYLIGQTDTTLRAVDDTYFYIYTPDDKIRKVIVENYEIESIKTDQLNNLDFPT